PATTAGMRSIAGPSARASRIFILIALVAIIGSQRNSRPLIFFSAIERSLRLKVTCYNNPLALRGVLAKLRARRRLNKALFRDTTLVIHRVNHGERKAAICARTGLLQLENIGQQAVRWACRHESNRD